MKLDINQLDFSKADGLIPAIVQDARTQKVLMLGYMNREALEKTLAEGKVTFFSRSKGRLWTKGESSGNFLHLKSVVMDCDQDTVLVQAEPQGPVCHTGSDTCFQEVNSGAQFLQYLQAVIQDRRDNPQPGSYTTRLFERGINKVAQKVGEEAVELLIEAKDNNESLFLNEAADLMYHLLVLLAAKGHTLEEVTKVLEERHQ